MDNFSNLKTIRTLDPHRLRQANSGVIGHRPGDHNDRDGSQFRIRRHAGDYLLSIHKR